MDSTGTPRVLVVEGNQAVAESLRVILETVLPVAVHVTGDPDEALTDLHQNHPDLVFLGGIARQYDPLTAVKQLRADPTASQVPIVAFGLLPDEVEAAKTARCACDDVLPLPFRVQNVLDATHRFLDIEPRGAALSMGSLTSLFGGRSHRAPAVSGGRG